MPGLLDPGGTLPEAGDDLAAQMRAVADATNPKDAMFVAAGGRMPEVPDGIHAAHRRDGTLLTSNAAKANAFRKAPVLTDAHMAALLGYPESKGQALARGAAGVVEARDNAGRVVQQHLASHAGMPMAMMHARMMAPNVGVTTPQQALAGRVRGLLGDV